MSKKIRWKGALRRRRSSRAERNGVIFVLFTIMLVIFVGMVAMSVDVGYMVLVRSQLRTATDAAARAGGESLGRTQSVSSARNAAKNLAASNLVAGNPLTLDDSDIVFGNSSLQSNGAWSFTLNGTPINSVRVTGRRTSDSLNGSVQLFFGRVFEVDDFQPSKVATVIRSDRDICLVIDRSSSMKLDMMTTEDALYDTDPRFPLPPNPIDSRWAALASAVQVFNDTIALTNQIEHVGMVSYASDGTWAGVENHASDIDQELTSNTSLITSAIQSISSRAFNGMTEISTGLNDGIAVLVDPVTSRPFAMRTIVLFTDGVYTNDTRPQDVALGAAALGITIHTITFGNAVNQVEMQAVADVTGGKHYHALTATELENAFRVIALSTSVTLTE